ncbi:MULTISPECIES: branched-chain amino acid ABC transporter permease [unclassified Archaeoglobus]|uniref:branched-chain amino acid ABC transporter permease n=1 Tax=unclassified Archaeoglobus TaxID=2643606 RepID=UPI0025BBD1DA|nr:MULTISPECIES: branched-chain amino acid ABC transporter permease [unclassified Archaeoglobus]
MLDVAALIFSYTFIFGSLYLGIALGFTIITGVLRIFHLGYGAIFLIAAYGTWMFWKDVGFGFIESIVLSFALVALFSFLIYQVVIKKFWEMEDYLLAALIAVFIIIEELVNYAYPEIVGVYLPTTIIEGSISIGPASIPGQLAATSVIAILMVICYLLIFTKTKTGLIMRAISQDIFASQLVGVNFDRMFIVAMILASLPPAIIMLLIAPIWALNPFIGWPLFTYAIVVSVLGGLGNLRGTIMASYIIGFIHAAVGFSLDPRLMLLASLVVVVAVLVFRPEGLARAETIW